MAVNGNLQLIVKIISVGKIFVKNQVINRSSRVIDNVIVYYSTGTLINSQP